MSFSTVLTFKEMVTTGNCFGVSSVRENHKVCGERRGTVAVSRENTSYRALQPAKELPPLRAWGLWASEYYQHYQPQVFRNHETGLKTIRF